ncbi:MAG: hypothetical protein ABSG65_25590 [Bryobacteraceae bacterium]
MSAAGFQPAGARGGGVVLEGGQSCPQPAFSRLPEIVILGLRLYPMANPKYAVSDRPVPVSELVSTLSDGTKVKRRVPRMRACNEKDAKGKLCAGHLKRWYFFGDEVKQKFGADAEVYRCEHCKTLYLPNSEEEPRTGTLSF